MDQFDEPQEFRSSMNREGCCSNCNSSKLSLDTLHSHYLYQERAAKSTARERRIMQHLTTWCERQLPKVWPVLAFTPITNLFLPKDQLIKLALDYQEAASTQECFRRILGPWDWEDEYSEDLWLEFVLAVQRENERPARQPHPVRYDHNPAGVTTWASISTPDSIARSFVQESAPIAPGACQHTPAPHVIHAPSNTGLGPSKRHDAAGEGYIEKFEKRQKYS